MELEVMLGNIKNWPSNVPSVETLGTIILMNLVTIIPPGLSASRDRYLVLFEKHLLLLSISREMTSFNFEICWSLSDIVLLPRNNSQSSSVEFMIKSSGESNGQSSSSLEDEVDKLNDSNGKWTVTFSNMELACDWFSTMTEWKFKCDSLGRSINESATNENLNLKFKVTSESSSLSSAGTGTAAKTANSWSDAPVAAARSTGRTSSPSTSTPVASTTVTSPYVTLSGYWISNSILPHPPLKLPDVNLGKKSAKDTSGSVRPSSPADDMAILAVIESYCSGGGKRKPIAVNATGKQESSNGRNESISSGMSDEFKNVRLEDLAVEVKLLRGEVKQLRSDLDFVINQLKIHAPHLPLSSK